jgi:hypothetical protein
MMPSTYRPGSARLTFNPSDATGVSPARFGVGSTCACSPRHGQRQLPKAILSIVAVLKSGVCAYTVGAKHREGWRQPLLDANRKGAMFHT